MTGLRFEELRKTVEAFATGLGGAPERGAKWQRILDAASDLFVQQGFRKTSVEEIAQRAHVAKGTVYLYFRTKAGILLHAVVQEKKGYLGRLAPVFDPSVAPADRLGVYLRTVVRLAGEMPLLSSVLQGNGEVLATLEEELDPDLREQMLEFQRGFLAELIAESPGAEALEREELRDRATVILGLLHSSAFFAEARTRHGLPAERFGEILANMIASGVAAPAATEPFARLEEA